MNDFSFDMTPFSLFPPQRTKACGLKMEKEPGRGSLFFIHLPHIWLSQGCIYIYPSAILARLLGPLVGPPPLSPANRRPFCRNLLFPRLLEVEKSCIKKR